MSDPRPDRAATLPAEPTNDTTPAPPAAVSHDGADDNDDDVVVLSWWQHPVNVLTTLLATALIAGMIGWMVGRTSNEVPTSDVDRGFLWDMRPHHEQAVTMANLFLERPDTNSGLREIARSIRFGQSIEIGVMVRLLEEMGAETVSDEGTAMSWMNDGVGMNEADMPGMATDAELEALSTADAADADELFAELMIAHHEGGLHMMDAAAERAANPDVRRYAAAWANSQRDEINEIRGVLESG